VSNVVLVAQSGPPSNPLSITLSGTGGADHKTTKQTIAGVTPWEAAVFVEGALAKQFMPDLSKTTVVDVQHVLNGITQNDPGQQQPRQLDHHHSWAIVGGEMHSGATGAAFHGFFQICLEESRFTTGP
jgi:hypothetical protein